MDDITRTSTKRQEIIDAAYRCFYDGGFHGTGIDTVMADTGISKRTLYKYFPSKEDLIEAVLDKYGDDVEGALFQPALARSSDPREQIKAIFDVRREMMDSFNCQGCLAQKAAQEYMGKHAGIEARGKISGYLVENHLKALCEKADMKNPAGTALQINMLLQGAVALSQMRRETTAFDAAKKTLALLLA